MLTSASLMLLFELGYLFLGVQARAIESRNSIPTTEHVFPLMRRSVAPGSKISQLPGIANLTRVGGGVSFSTKVSLGQETYDMIVDTGSSDTWVASKTLQCTYFGIEVSQAFCKFGPLYDRQTFKKIQGQNFRIQYGDGTEATGDMGYDSVTLGGINVPSQEIAVVERAFWQGDSVTSGLLGFSYPSITSAYNGTDPSKDQHRKNQLPYDPLLTTMYKQGSINPVFSLAINRGANNEPAGVLALGGIPSEFQSLTYARTPIARTNFLNEDEPSAAIPSKYEFYALYPEAFLYGPPSSKNTSTMPDPTTLTNDTRRLIHIVDSGTTLNILPQPLAANIAAAYTPPAISPSGGIYVVNCRATPPIFGVQIGGQVFYVNPTDMIMQQGGTCYATVANGGMEAPFILGDPFFKSTVVVFDLERNEVRVGGREFY